MGGKGEATQVAQPAPSPYETQLAAMSKDLYESTDPLRDTYISQWMKYLSPTQTLRPGAVPTYASYGASGTTGTPGGMFIDPNTGRIYGGQGVTEWPMPNAEPPTNQSTIFHQAAIPGRAASIPTSTDNWLVKGLSGDYSAKAAVPESYFMRTDDGRITLTPYGGAGGGTAGLQGLGQPQYKASDYITQQYNPADLPGYLPQYDIARRGLEAQYSTAMGNAVATTPRGGAMSDALNKLNLARAESVGGLPNQISGGLISDMLNKSYGAAFNTPAQSISGLGAANQSYTSTQNAMINAQTAANAQSAQSKGGLGAGIGTVVGSAFGSPWVGSAVGGALGSLGGK